MLKLQYLIISILLLLILGCSNTDLYITNEVTEMSINSSIINGTTGSVLFIGENNTLVGDNSFQYNDSLNQLKVIAIDSTGILKLNPNANGDIELFGDVDVGDGESGKYLTINRKAAEGDSYIALGVTSSENPRISASGGSFVIFDTENGEGFAFGQNPTASTSFRFGSSYANANVPFRYYGYVSSVSTPKYVQFKVSQTGNLELSRQDTNINYFDVKFPMLATYLHITTPSSTDVGQIIQGAASQSVDLKQYLKSDDTLYSGVNNIGERYQNDSVKNWFGTGMDSSIYYDGTDLIINPAEVGSGVVKIGDATINYSKFETDGTLQFNGAATVWKDINIGALSLSGPPGLQPGIVNFIDEAAGDTGIATYGLAVGEGFSGLFEMQHDYKEGSDVVFHIHWQGITAPTGTDKVKFELTYTIANDETTLDEVTAIVIETDFDTRYEFKKSDFPTITGTNIDIGNQFMFTLKRIAASADEYTGEALVATVGIHYEVDTIGSRTITTK